MIHAKYKGFFTVNVTSNARHWIGGKAKIKAEMRATPHVKINVLIKFLYNEIAVEHKRITIAVVVSLPYMFINLGVSLKVI